MKIQREDLREMSYQEFGELLNTLTKKIEEYVLKNNLKIDLVVPILRSGGFTGLHLASKLKIINILPAQYKYIYSQEIKIEKKFDFPKLNFTLPPNRNILIVDSNTVHKKIAAKVITDVYDLYPMAKLYFASALIDQSIKSLDFIEQIFYGELSNEGRFISNVEAEKMGITNEIRIFPWENIDEEWESLNT
ncbi:MAG TPA: phosphoribosyltransferase [Candidatus Limnocylindrales bacterium]|nr:phosphoribosyltransferase [Candidatus Limnocylindrales bacterium]